jgi:hypothetical protein
MGRTQTTAYPHFTPGPPPRSPIIQRTSTRLKDACGAGDTGRATGPVLDPAARTHGTGSYAGKGAHQASPARLQTAHDRKTPGRNRA